MTIEFTTRKSKQIVNGQEIPCITPFTISVSEPHGIEPVLLTKEDVFGSFDIETMTQLSKGMVIASTGNTCPIWWDKVHYKSSTILFDNKDDILEDVIYWCEYVDGRDSVSKIKHFKNGKVAIRTDYQCW